MHWLIDFSDKIKSQNFLICLCMYMCVCMCEYESVCVCVCVCLYIFVCERVIDKWLEGQKKKRREEKKVDKKT